MFDVISNGKGIDVERNFLVGQSNELVVGDRTFDIHNSYDFGGIAIASGGCVRLWFTPNQEHGRGVSAFVLDVTGVDRLELSEGVALGAVRDLEEVGFKNPDDNDLDWLVSEVHASRGDHLLFSFGSKEYIRVHGERCHLEEYHGSVQSLPGSLVAS